MASTSVHDCEEESQLGEFSQQPLDLYWPIRPSMVQADFVLSKTDNTKSLQEGSALDEYLVKKGSNLRMDVRTNTGFAFTGGTVAMWATYQNQAAAMPVEIQDGKKRKEASEMGSDHLELKGLAVFDLVQGQGKTTTWYRDEASNIVASFPYDSNGIIISFLEPSSKFPKGNGWIINLKMEGTGGISIDGSMKIKCLSVLRDRDRGGRRKITAGDESCETKRSRYSSGTSTSVPSPCGSFDTDSDSELMELDRVPIEHLDLIIQDMENDVMEEERKIGEAEARVKAKKEKINDLKVKRGIRQHLLLFKPQLHE